MDATIEKATEHDLPALLSLYRQFGDEPLPLEQAVQTFRTLELHPDFAVFVCRKDDRTVGTFSLLILENLAHGGRPSALIENVVVAEAYRGQGIGKAMIRFALDKAREKGCYKMVLSSNQTRVDAHRFYESLGFEQHGFCFRISL